jgi:hypothetical protein
MDPHPAGGRTQLAYLWISRPSMPKEKKSPWRSRLCDGGWLAWQRTKNRTAAPGTSAGLGEHQGDGVVVRTCSVADELGRLQFEKDEPAVAIRPTGQTGRRFRRFGRLGSERTCLAAKPYETTSGAWIARAGASDGVKSVVSSTMRARADVHTRARPRGCDGPGSRSRPSRAQLEGVDRWRHTVCSALEDIRVGSKTGRRLLPTTAVGVLRTRGFTSSGSLSCRRSMLGLDRAAEAMRQAGS